MAKRCFSDIDVEENNDNAKKLKFTLQHNQLCPKYLVNNFERQHQAQPIADDYLEARLVIVENNIAKLTSHLESCINELILIGNHLRQQQSVIPEEPQWMSYYN